MAVLGYSIVASAHRYVCFPRTKILKLQMMKFRCWHQAEEFSRGDTRLESLIHSTDAHESRFGKLELRNLDCNLTC